MTVYGPDITDELQNYATIFDDLQVTQRNAIVDINAINPLSELRDQWSNVESDQTEYNLTTSANSEDISYIRTQERGQYTAGYEAKFGIGARVESPPQNSEVMRWGYFTTDDTQTPLDGWYFGVDSEGVFVCEVRDTVKDKVYQENWNLDVCDGSEKYNNPSDFNLDLSKGNIFQGNFIYYGYGPVTMKIVTDKGVVNVHKFTHDGQTSVTNTNLPLAATVKNNATTSDAQDLYIGGRQFSVIGQQTQSTRNVGNYVESITVDDTAYVPIMSLKIKDGSSNLGLAKDFSYIIGFLSKFSANPDSTGYRWQLRRGTELDTTTWETPTTHDDKINETGMKVDTSATDITDVDGNKTGVFVDGGTLAEGTKNTVSIEEDDIVSSITNGTIVTLLIKATPNSSGTVSDLFLEWQEAW